jgi:DNA-binding GntR family transcriptional regulator
LFCLTSQATNQRTVSDHKKLSRLLEEMSIAARGGASLEFFEYQEKFDRMSPNFCDRATSDQVVKEFVKVLREVLYEDKVSKSKIMKEKRLEIIELRRLLGAQDYLRCEKSFSSRMSLTHLVSFESFDQSYQFQLERGYED